MDAEDFNGRLIWVIDNCIFAYDQLCTINKKLKEEFDKVQRRDFSSNTDMNYLGAMNSMLQDYLTVRVAGLFDKPEYKVRGETHKVVTFEKILSEDKTYKRAKSQEIVEYIQ